MKSVEILFWILAAIVFYTYAGYGLVIWIVVKIKEFFIKPEKRDESWELPEITLLIAAYNEEEVIQVKMENTRGLRYPAGKLKVVWITDGSTDETNRLLSLYPEITLLYQPERKGKTAAINRAMQYINTPLVAFSDANTMINEEAIEEMARLFADPQTGCVAGEKRVHHEGAESVSSGGEGIYWRYESALKKLDSRLFSTVGAAGELYAIRRELFEEIRSDTLLDDFVLSMNIAAKGYRIVYCSKAYALEPGSLNMGEESKRKIRISAGGIQAVIRLRKLFNVFKYPVLSFQYISHRVLRWTVAPLSLFLLLPLNIILVICHRNLLYDVFLAGQVLFYLLGFSGHVLGSRKRVGKVLLIPYYFLFMNINVIRGFFFLLMKKKGDGTWEKVRRSG
jgi:cellulose synthase/poly-beta-1,6-N-acetylglucosamine synthase-like glycosyltransferase